MARILPLNGMMWCADMVWRDYGTRPSGATLRAEGRLAHATHYARYPGRPQSAAFITISRGHAGSGLNSLAIATAAVLGPLSYAEFDMGGALYGSSQQTKTGNCYRDRTSSMTARQSTHCVKHSPARLTHPNTVLPKQTSKAGSHASAPLLLPYARCPYAPSTSCWQQVG